MATRPWPVLLNRLRCCMGKQQSRASSTLSREFALIPSEEAPRSQEVPVNEEDDTVAKEEGYPVVKEEEDPVVVEYFKRLLTEVSVLGALSWASMPITFALAWMDYTLCSYGFIAVKQLLSSMAQWHIGRQLDDRPARLKLEPLKVEMREVPQCMQGRCAQWLWQLVTTGCDFVLMSAGWILRFAEAIDPDTDAMTPGSTRNALNDEDQDRFARRWMHVPGVGLCLANLGLPRVLAAGLVAVSAWQLFIFLESAYARRSDSCKAKVKWCALFHLSDMAALHMLSPRFQSLWQETRSEMVQATGGDRFKSYKCRVPEMVLQGWFSVTALALTIDNAAWKEVGQMMFSICSTWFASVKSFYDMASIYVPWCRQQRELGQRESGGKYTWNPEKCFVMMVIHVVGFVAICAKLACVRVCDSHECSLCSMRCV